MSHDDNIKSRPFAVRDAFQQHGSGSMPIHTGSGDIHIHMPSGGAAQPNTPSVPERAPYVSHSSPIQPPRHFLKRLVVDGWWYFLVAVLTGGAFAWVPFLHAAIRLQARSLYICTMFFGVAGSGLLTLNGMFPRVDGAEPHPVRSFLGVMGLAVIVCACLLLVKVRRRVYIGSAQWPDRLQQIHDSAVIPPKHGPIVQAESKPSPDLASAKPEELVESRGGGSRAIVLGWIGRTVLWILWLFFFLGVAAGFYATSTGQWAEPADYIGGNLCYGVPFVVLTFLGYRDVRKLKTRRNSGRPSTWPRSELD